MGFEPSAAEAPSGIWSPPAGATDCHLHVFGDPGPYPLAAGRSYTPRSAGAKEYRTLSQHLGLQRAVVVQPSVYGFDNACTRDAIAALGLATTRGVAALRPEAPDQEIAGLHEAGFRGVRFITQAQGGAALDDLRTVATRIAPYGWHVQLYVPGETWADLFATLLDLSVPVVIDHAGVAADVSRADAGFSAVARLLDTGRAWIKLSGCRTSREGFPYRDGVWLLREWASRAPERCLWGSDWPHPLMEDAVPGDREIFDLLPIWFEDEALRRRILVENPQVLYGFPALTPAEGSP